VIKEEDDGLVMEAVAGPLGPKMAEQRMAKKRQVADKIKDLMADEFIPVAEGSADDFLFIEDHDVIQVSSESKAAPPELDGILQEPERSGGGDFFKKDFSSQEEGNLLAADERMGEINRIGHSEFRVREEGQAGPFFFEGVRFDDPDRLGWLGNRPLSRMKDGLNQGSRASVQDGDFTTLELELDAVETKNIQDRKEMLQSLNPARIKDKAGTIQGLDLTGIDLNFPAAQVNPPEKNLSPRGGIYG
jgi:hypothetical protein